MASEEKSLGETMGEVEVCEALRDLIEMEGKEYGLGDGIRSRSFSEAGVMTSNIGMVIRLADGSEYQITVIRSR